MSDASIDCERVDRLERRTLVVRGEIDLVSAAEFRANLDALLHEARDHRGTSTSRRSRSWIPARSVP